jgi:site-specific recombinase XerD
MAGKGFGKTIMKDPKGFLTIDQIRKLLEVALKSNIRDYMLLLTMFKTGRRVSEVLLLKRGDIDFENKRVVFSVLKRRIAIRRWFEVDKEVTVALKKYCEVYRIIEADDILFPITRQRVFQLFRKYCKAINIEWIGEKKPHPHHLRHCLKKDTLIQTPKGLLTAYELYKQGGCVMSYDIENNKIIESKVIANNKHITTLLEINAGCVLYCSKNHTLFTISDKGITEVFAKDLKIGNYLAILNNDFEGNMVFEENTNEKCRIIGYFLGDGHIRKDKKYSKYGENSYFIDAYDKNKEILEFYKVLFKRVFNKECKIFRYKNRNSYFLRVMGRKKDLYLELSKYNLNLRSKNRIIPKELFCATREERIQFLSGFYDAEGYSSCGYTSSNKELILGIQNLLLSLGITSSFYERKRMVKLPQGKIIDQTQYSLYIHDRKTFVDTIKSVKKFKYDSIDRLEKYPIQNIIKEICIKHITNKNRYKGYFIPKLQKYGIKSLKRYTKICCSKKIVLSLISVLEEVKDIYYSNLLKNIINNYKIRWFRIKSIKELPEEETYDFTIKDKNLITNGILSHNSFAVQFIQAGNTQIEDLKVLQEYLGHASIDSTSCYLQFDKDLYRKKLERIPKVILSPVKPADNDTNSDVQDKKADKPDKIVT